MGKSKKDQSEKDLEKLAKTLLSTPPKPREESKARKDEKKIAKTEQKEDGLICMDSATQTAYES